MRERQDLATDIEIRSFDQTDLPWLTGIYNHYVVHTAATFDLEPFTLEQRKEWLGHYQPHGPHRLLVARDRATVLGYATSSPFRGKAAYNTSVETSVYCRPRATRQGVGTRLYAALFEALAGEDLHRAYAGIALPNDASIRLHEHFGFREVGIYREVGHKFGRYWDVMWMERELP